MLPCFYGARRGRALGGLARLGARVEGLAVVGELARGRLERARRHEERGIAARDDDLDDLGAERRPGSFTLSGIRWSGVS